ncbi:MAG: aromatic ring-hydroxylating dioxygenase subunit alpha [Pseudomonadota bacterium]
MPDQDLQEADWAARRDQVALRQQKAYVDRIRAGVGDLAANGFMENDARVYTDPTRLEAEIENVFKGQPILAALSQDLPKPGAVFLFEELGTSIIITRNKAGEVQAFLNMCTHRAAKLTEESCVRKLLTCPFHGWSFDLNGRLVAVPEAEAFENMDREAKSLVPVPCTEWAGMIFIIPRPGDDPIDIGAHLGDFAIELEQLELHKAEPVKNGIIEADCNWKYALDTYGEGYHFPVLHPKTVSPISRTETLYESFGRHHRIGWAARALAELVDAPEADWPKPDYSGVHYLFPNTVLFFGTVSETAPFAQVFRHFPNGVGKMYTRFAVYAPGGVRSEAHREEVATLGFDATAHVVATEDYWIASNGWARLKSAPEGFKVTYGANELALQDQHRNIAEAAGMALDVYS